MTETTVSVARNLTRAVAQTKLEKVESPAVEAEADAVVEPEDQYTGIDSSQSAMITPQQMGRAETAGKWLRRLGKGVGVAAGVAAAAATFVAVGPVVADLAANVVPEFATSMFPAAMEMTSQVLSTAAPYIVSLAVGGAASAVSIFTVNRGAAVVENPRDPKLVSMAQDLPVNSELKDVNPRGLKLLSGTKTSRHLSFESPAPLLDDWMERENVTQSEDGSLSVTDRPDLKVQMKPVNRRAFSNLDWVKVDVTQA